MPCPPCRFPTPSAKQWGAIRHCQQLNRTDRRKTSPILAIQHSWFLHVFFFRNRRRKTENAAFSLCSVSISGKEGPCKRVNKSVTEIVAGWIKCRVHSESWKTIEAEMISFELVANYSAAWATCCVPLGMNSISHYDKEIPRKFSVMFVFPKENSNQ